MMNVWWIAKRELAAYLRTPTGYIILAATLALDGLLFNAFVVAGSKPSADVLGTFFLYTGGACATASIFLAMRLIAEEKQTGTLVLLTTSPVRDWQIVAGKFAAGVAFLALLNALSVYMPVLIAVHGKISLGHMASGYLGVMLIASAALALSLMCSAFAPNQLVSVILGAAIVVTFVLFWKLSKIASPPLDGVLSYLSLFDKHCLPFFRGLVSVQDVVFYVTLIYVPLVVTTRVLEARRWR